MAIRKTRSDCRVGTFEKKHGLPPGTIRNRNGRDTRSDKKIGTIRRDYNKNAKGWLMMKEMKANDVMKKFENQNVVNRAEFTFE